MEPKPRLARAALHLVAGIAALLLAPVPAAAQTSLYMRTTTSPVTGYSGLATARGAASTSSVTSTVVGPATIQWTTTATGGTALAWISPPLTNAPTITGNITCNTWAAESSTNANATVRCEVYRFTGGTLQPAFCAATFGSELTATAGAKNFTCAATSTTFAAGDRIAVRWFITDAGGTMTASGRSVTATYNGATAGAAGDSYVTIPAGITLTFGNGTVVGDGTNPTSSTVAPGTGAAALDAFTLQTDSANDTVTGATVTLSAGSAGGLSQVEITNDAGTTVYGSASNPASDTVTFSPLGTNIAATSASTQYRVRVTPKTHANMPVPPGSTYAVTGTVTGLTSSASKTYLDAGSATVTVDNQSPAAPDTVSAAPGNASATVGWNNPTDADFNATLVLYRGGASVGADKPTEGQTYTAGNPIGSSTVGYVGTTSPQTIGGLANGTVHYFKLFARDTNGNWSVASAEVTATPAVPQTTVGNGASEPGDAAVGPYAGTPPTPTAVDRFTLKTSSSTDTVTGATVTLSTVAGVERVEITDDSGATVYGFASNPPSSPVSITFTTNITATINETPYLVRVRPMAHSAMPAVPGGTYAVTATVIGIASGNNKSYGDTGSSSLTIDNQSPSAPGGVSATGANGSATVAWTNPADADFNATLVLYRGGASVGTDAPAEGATYLVGNPIGSSTVGYVGTASPQVIGSLVNGTAYSFKLFARDANGNWSVASAEATATPFAASPAITGTGLVAAATGVCPARQVTASAAYTGDGNNNSTIVFSRGPSATGPWTQVCSLGPGGANPRVCVDNAIPSAGTWYYQAAYGDVDGVSGSPQVSAPVGVCVSALALSSPGQPTGATLAAGAAHQVVLRLQVAETSNNAAADLTGVKVTNQGTAVAGADVQAVQLWSDANANGLLDAGEPLLANGVWNGSAYAFSGFTLNVPAGASRQLLVTLAVGPGATSGRTFQGQVIPAGLTVKAPASAAGADVNGSLFTMGAGPTDGSTDTGAPVAIVVNPRAGATVSSGTGPSDSAIRVQVHAFHPSGNAANIASVTLSADNGATFPTTLSPNPNYDGKLGAGARLYETTTLKLAPGTYTLVARVTDTSVPAKSSTSVKVPVTVNPSGRGDGKLLVRDNAGQLCSDCHALPTHSSQYTMQTGATATNKGAWGFACSDCHTPHSTTNIYLVSKQITPPSIQTQQPAKTVYFSRADGYVPGGGAANKPNASFVNDDATGPCQVCHTRTSRFTSAGGVDTTHTALGRCSDCHQHTQGFKGSGTCATCHLGAADLDEYVYGANGKSLISTSEWTTYGHGLAAASTYPSGNPGAGLDAQGAAVQDRGCAYCHNDAVGHGDGANFFRLANTGGADGLNGVCLVCHKAGAAGGYDPDAGGGNYVSITGARKVGTAHYGVKHPGAAGENGGQYCWDCHDPHGDRSVAGFALWYMMQQKPVVLSGGAVPPSVPVTFAADIEFRADLGGNTGAIDYQDYVSGAGAAGSKALCANCHASTQVSHYASIGGLAGDGHGVGAGTPNNRCTDCHKHSTEFGAACNSCHAAPPNVGRHYTHDEVLATPAAYPGTGTPTAAQYAFGCNKCHAGTHFNSAAAGTQANPKLVEVVLDGSAANYLAGAETAVVGTDGQTYFGWSSGTCTTTCHSNAAPVGGTASRANTFRAPRWGDAVTGSCTICHAPGTASDSLSPAHQKHLATYGYGCQRCHNGTTTTGTTITNKALHANGAKDWAFDNSGGMNNTGGSYDIATSKTCSNIYCHSNGTVRTGSTFTASPLAWTSATGSTCTSCHGDSLTLATGAHQKHVNQLAVLGTNYTCSSCHAGTVAAGNGPVTGTSAHVDMAVAISSGTWSGGACSATYCHSSGQAGAANVLHSVNWTTDALDCKGCHGRYLPGAFTSQFGEPNYTSGAPGSGSANSHQAHVGTNAASCQQCHSGMVNPTATGVLGSQHTDGQRQVAFAAGGTYTAGGATPQSCSGTSCHGTPATLPQWGGSATVGCTSCHNAPPTAGAHAKHDQVWAAQPYASTTNQTTAASYGFACNTCHAGTHANDANPGTLASPRLVEVTAGLGYSGGPGALQAELGPNGQYFGWSDGKSCATAYCHSNGGPLGAAPTYKPTTWGATLGCSGCHGDGTNATGMSAAHGKHILPNSSSAYAYNCFKCHTTTINAAGTTITNKLTHADQNHQQVAFDGTADPRNPSGGYTAGTFTCGTVYCHSDGQPLGAASPTYKSPTWNGGAMPADCTGCHGGNSTAAAILTTNKHGYHINNNGVIGTNYGCVDCHNATVSADRTILAGTGYAQHVDGGAKDVGFPLRNAMTSAAYATPTCASNYCHSSGRPATAGSTSASKYAAVTWSDAAWSGSVCGKCHGTYTTPADPDYGFPSVNGAPNYANGGPGLVNANSHQKHVGSAADCAICHQQTTANGTTINGSFNVHTDGQRQVTWDATRQAAGATYTPGGATPKSCSNTGGACHGTGQPQWGGPPQTCGNCHLGASDSPNYAYDGTMSVISSTEWTTTGHGSAAVAFAGANTCLYCHDDGVTHNTGTNPFRLRGASAVGGVTGTFDAAVNNGNAVCLNCHGTGSNGVDPDGGATGYALKTATKKIDSWHYGSKHSGTADGGSRCWDCHDGHGDANVKMIGALVVKDSSDAYGFNATRVTATFTANAAGADYRSVATSVCRTCHTTAAHYTPALADGHMQNVVCTRCHAHDQGAVNLAFMYVDQTACNGCHQGPPSAVPNLVGSHARHFEVTTSPASYADAADKTTAASYGFACARCHSGTHYSDSTNQGTAASPLVVEVIFSGGGTYTAGTAVNDTGPTGLVFKSSNGTCASSYCHSNGGPLGAAPTYQSPAPAWGGTTTCTSCHGGPDAATTMSAAHAKHVNSNGGSAYAYGCQKCHQPTTTTGNTITDKTKHADQNRQQVGFDSLNTGATYSGGTTYQCSGTYCHSNGNPLGGTLTSKLPAWNGGAMPADCTGCHGGDSATGANAIATNKHGAHVNNASVLGTNFGCVDCHNTTVSANRTILASTGYAQHVDGGAKDVGFPLRNTMTSAAYATPTCASNYCHSSGRPATTGSTSASKYASVSWNEAAWTGSICGRCHGTYTSADPDYGGWVALNGEPNYANGGANVVNSNTHRLHVTATGDCEHCHAGFVNAAGNAIAGSSHANGVRDVAILAVYDTNGATANYTQGTKTCAGVSCHGSGTPQWGASLGCNVCHNAPPTAGAHPKHDQIWAVPANGYSDTASQTTAASYGIACNTCHQGVHGNSTALGTAAAPKFAEVTAGLGYSGGGVTSATETSATSGLYFGYYTDRSCTTSYCHSNGGPLGAAPTYKPTTWGVTLACSGCHGDGTNATGMSAAHGKHILSNASSAYAYNCFKCHTTTINAAGTTISNKLTHVDQNHQQVAFDNTVDPRNPSGGYTTASFTCGTVYCHSDGQPLGAAAPTYKSPTWTGGAMPADCTGCHGGDSGTLTPIATNKHPQHITASGAIGAAYGCADCHNTTVSANRVILAPTGYAQHVDGGLKDVGFAARSGQTSGAYASPSCASNYCHSTGQDPAAVNAGRYKTVAWNQVGALDCKGCHGAETGAGTFTPVACEPNYQNGGAGAASANSHQAHVKAAADCAICHNSTSTTGTSIVTSATIHTDGQRQITWDATRQTAGATYTPGGATPKSCSSTGTACHASGTPQWGATLRCRDCHLASGTGNQDVDNYVYGDGVRSWIDQEDWLAYGHGATAAFAESGLPAANFDNGGAVDGCAYCHDTLANGGANHGDANNPFRLKNTGGTDGKIGVCLVCHKTGSAGVTVGGVLRNRTTSPAVSATHYGAEHTARLTGGGQYCWDCHDPHGDYNYGSAQRLAYMIQELPVMNHTLTTGTTDWGIPTATAPTPDFRANRDGTAAWGWGDYVSNTLVSGTYRGICQVCHTSTALYFQQTAYNTHNQATGNRCTACHLHEQPPSGAFAASESSGGSACAACHGPIYTSMTTGGRHYHKLVSDAATYATAAPTSATDPGRTCLMCHADHNLFRPDINTTTGGRAKNLRTDIATAPTVANGAFAASDFNNALTNGGICVSCHTNALTKGNSDPLGTTTTVAVPKAGYNLSSHNYAPTSTFNGTLTATFTANCSKCHNDDLTKQYQTSANQFGLHNSQDSSLTAVMGNPVTNETLEESFCYRCHSASTDTNAGLGLPAKAVTANDWYGAFTAMSAGSTGIFAAMQLGSPSTPGGAPTTTTDTLYFKPSAQEAAPVTLTGHYGNDTFASGTFGTRSMSPYAATGANELWDNAAVTTSTTNPARYRRVAFVSPPVATAVTLAAAAWTIAPYVQTSSTSPSPHTRYAIWKYDGTCTYVGASPTCQSIVARATYGSGTTNRWTTTLAQQTIATAAGSAVTLNVGDRIVVDLEVETQSTTATTNCLMNYGFGATAQSSVTIPNAVTFTYASQPTPSSGRHDVGSYAGKHKPSPTDETRASIAANKHVECADCHDPHEAAGGLHRGASTYTTTASSTLYLRNTGAINAVPPSSEPATYQYDSGTPYNTSTFNQRDMAPTSGATTASTNIANGTTAPAYARGLQFVSPQIDNTVTIPSGSTFTLTIRENQGTGTGTNYTRFTVYKWNGTAATPFNTSAAPGNFGQNATAITTTATNRSTTLSSNQAVTLNPGDAIVAEVEFYHSTGTAAINVTYAYGNFATDAAALALPAGTYNWRTGASFPAVVFAPVLQGASGVSVTTWGGNWAGVTTWNPSTTTAALPAATAEWQICFKCHSSANANVSSWGGSGAASFTDLSLEFNPNNEAYHPVIQALPSTGNRQLAAASLTGGWTPGMVMACSDCHGADATSASYGPHGSGVKWMLNPTTTGAKYYNWPYTTAASNGASSGTFVTGTGSTTVPGNNFCFSCHVWSGGGQAHTSQSSSHGVACVWCHIRVPHGGKMMRLLTSNNTGLPARYHPDGNGTDGTSMMNSATRPASGTLGQSGCFATGSCSGHTATGGTSTW